MSNQDSQSPKAPDAMLCNMMVAVHFIFAGGLLLALLTLPMTQTSHHHDDHHGEHHAEDEAHAEAEHGTADAKAGEAGDSAESTTEEANEQPH